MAYPDGKVDFIYKKMFFAYMSRTMGFRKRDLYKSDRDKKASLMIYNMLWVVSCRTRYEIFHILHGCHFDNMSPKEPIYKLNRDTSQTYFCAKFFFLSAPKCDLYCVQKFDLSIVVIRNKKIVI